nr:hypothetical protein [Tanacetum cinerariifolium]
LWQPQLSNKWRWMRLLFPAHKGSGLGEATSDYHQTFNPRNPLYKSSTMFYADVPSSRRSLLLQMNIDYAFLIWEDFVYQVEHKNHKKSNEMYYPKFTKTNEEIRNTKAYKEYYAYATGEAAPKPKASARRKRSGSDTSITPPTAITTPTTTVAITPRLTAAAKGKQQAKAKSPSEPSEVPGVPSDDSEEEISWNSSDDEDADAQEKDRDDDEGNQKDESNDKEEDDDDDKDGDE